MQRLVLLLALFLSLFVILLVTPQASAQGPSGTKPRVANAALGTSFTYQGQLKNSGGPVNGSCDLRFGLWDDPNTGSQVGVSPQTKPGVTIANGMFTVQLDFGSGAFDGGARWLAIEVACPAGSASYTPLTPRQPLTAEPYALYAGAAGSAANADLLDGQHASYFAASAHNHDASYWHLAGNGGTTPSNFIGTTDNVSLTLKVNNVAGWRLAPNGTNTPNVIGGYSGNIAASGISGATIAGGGTAGSPNQVTADYATIGGGAYNAASDGYATVSGGTLNLASGGYASVVGGWDNLASGYAATVGGGRSNTAGGAYSFVAGYGARNTNSNHYGVFLFADDASGTIFPSTVPNQFRVRSTGGVQFVLAIDGGGNPTYSCSASNGTPWACSSDRNVKENLVAVNAGQVLARVDQLPLYYWNAKGVDPSNRHLGPMAQDFYAAFGLGTDDKSISTIDLDGVSLAAIQELHREIQEKDAQIAALKAENAKQEERLASLEARVTALDQGAPAPRPAQAGLLENWWLWGGLVAVGLVAVSRVQWRGAGH